MRRISIGKKVGPTILEIDEINIESLEQGVVAYKYFVKGRYEVFILKLGEGLSGHSGFISLYDAIVCAHCHPTGYIMPTVKESIEMACKSHMVFFFEGAYEFLEWVK